MESIEYNSSNTNNNEDTSKTVNFEEISSSVADDIKKVDEEKFETNVAINIDPFTETKKYFFKNNIFELLKVF
jgi:hypothetical protein